MSIDKVFLKNFRPFTDLKLDLSNNNLLLTGVNGTGKTSVLEAINVLITGKSFKTRDLKDCIKDNSKEKVDLNFYQIIKILNKFKIKYWICQGTLLGIIRDNQLIPWDHDIDIAVWSGSVSKEKIKEIMLSHNFNLKKKYLLEDDLLTFTKQGGREVDFNLYQITIEKNSNKKLAFVNWYIPKNFLFKFIEALSLAKTYDGKLKYLIRSLSIFQPIFNKLKIFLISKKIFYQSAGYTQPLELLKEFKDIVFYDINLTVPKKSEEYLRYVYGENWKIPKRKFNWIKDSPSTIKK